MLLLKARFPASIPLSLFHMDSPRRMHIRMYSGLFFYVYLSRDFYFFLFFFVFGPNNMFFFSAPPFRKIYFNPRNQRQSSMFWQLFGLFLSFFAFYRFVHFHFLFLLSTFILSFSNFTVFNIVRWAPPPSQRGRIFQRSVRPLPYMYSRSTVRKKNIFVLALVPSQQIIP